MLAVLFKKRIRNVTVVLILVVKLRRSFLVLLCICHKLCLSARKCLQHLFYVQCYQLLITSSAYSWAALT